MAKISLKLYRSKVLSDGRSPIMIRLTSNGTRVQLSTGLKYHVDEWDSVQERPKKTNGSEIVRLSRIKTKAWEIWMETKNPFLWKQRMKNDQPVNVDFLQFLKSYQTELFQSGRVSNSEKYGQTFNLLKSIFGSIPFSVMDVGFLDRLEKRLFARGMSINTVGFYLRTIRATYNRAIDRGLVPGDQYPFRRFRIKKQATRKLALTVDQMNLLIRFDGRANENWARDLFLLSFLFMGANPVDLYSIDTNGPVIHYRRAKTGSLYRVRVEPETLKVLRRLNGFPLPGGPDRRKTAKSKNRMANEKLKVVGNFVGESNLVFGSARHSWATIARDIGINRELIRACLGHKTGQIVDVYLAEFDDREIFEANRRVIETLNFI